MMSNGGPPHSQPPGYPGAPPPYTEYPGEQYPGGVIPPTTTANYALGFCVPPLMPAQHIYPPQPPSAYPVAPPPYPGGTSLYPDVNQLPQPQTVPYGFPQISGTFPVPPQPSEGHVIPMRPAPAPPTHSVPSQPDGQTPLMPNSVTEFPRDQQQNPNNNEALKNGIAPPGCVVSWRGALGLKLYFIQQEGHIISPLKPLSLTVYKKIGGTPNSEDPNLLGMLEVPGVWRLKLRSKRSFCLHTYPDSYVFVDDSTNPNRVVILQLPEDVSTTMLADLLALLNELTDLREEQEGVVDKITSGVSTVYTDLTKKINTVVRDAAPGTHKSTKWFRKGTGSLVRMGGNIVAKGMHLLADQVNPGQPQEEESAEHSYLVESLTTFRKKLQGNEITYV